MNQTNQQHALSLGPCADYEFDLIEQSEGVIAPELATRLQQHLAHCARCRAYAAALVELDSQLADVVLRPSLSPEFDERLAARIAGLQRGTDRTGALAAVEREHQQSLRALGRGVGWRTALNAAALGSVVGSVLLSLGAFAPQLLQAHDLVPAGFSATTTFATALGIAAVACGLAFSRRQAGGV